MGMLNWSNAFSAAGSALGAVGIEGMKASLEQDKIRLADQLAGKREEASDTRRSAESLASDTRHSEAQRLRDEAAPALAAKQAGLINDANVDSTVRNADRLRAVHIADVTEAFNAELKLKTDPANVQLLAEAEAQKAKVIATSAAATAAELVKTPGYLKNLEAITLAQNPEKRAAIAASMSSAALNNFKLGQEKLVQSARKELGDATTPEARTAAKSKIEALEWSVSTERAQATADAAVLNTLEKNIKDARTEAANPMSDEATRARATDTANRAQGTYDALREEYAKNRGLKPPPVGAKTGWDNSTGEVWKDGAMIGKATSAKSASDMIHKPVAPVAPGASPRRGMLNDTPAYTPPAGSEAARIVARRAAEKQGEADSRTLVQTSFDRDVGGMSAQELYDQYGDLVGKLTPLQRARYQAAIRK